MSIHVTNVMRSLNPIVGGPPVSVPSVSKPLRELGCKVDYLSTTYGYSNIESIPKTGEYKYAKWVELNGPKDLYYSFNFKRELNKLIDDTDIIHNQGIWGYPLQMASKLSKRNNKPLIITARGEFEPWRVKNSTFKFLKKMFSVKIFNRELISYPSRIIALTENEMKGFREVGYHGKISVVPNGVFLPSEKIINNSFRMHHFWPETKDRFCVLFLSRISKEKGLDQLIPAWANAISSAKETAPLLILAGPDDRGYKKTVLEMIEKYGLENYVLITGYVKGEEKSALFSGADLFTLPSYSEGFSMALLEAAAYGLPVIFTHGCNFDELEQENSGLKVELNAGSLTEGLNYFMKLNTEECRTIGRRGRELVKNNYTWEKVAERLYAVYENVLEE